MLQWIGMEGRLRRTSYVTGVFAWCLVVATVLALIKPFGSYAELGGRLDHLWANAGLATPAWKQGAFLILALGAGWVSLSLSVRRLHDIGASGWWALAQLTPPTSTILFVALALARGSVGENRYGADPRPDYGAPATA